MNRREFIGLGALAAMAAGCGRVATAVAGDGLPEDYRLPVGDVSPEFHLLNRAGFGPRPGDVAVVRKMGIPAWVRAQFSPTDVEPLAMRLQVSRIEAARLDQSEIRDYPVEEVLRQLQQATLLRAVFSPWQVRERLVDFWSNHFNVYGKKNLGAYYKVNDDAGVIRGNALSSFPKLLFASSRSPAMLAYLDNPSNDRRAPNENYARELLELHTLGIEGGYTQRDVQEVARCFTGWTVENRFLHRRGTLRFDPDAHDGGAKLVLGTVIPPGGGEKDVDLVLDFLCRHPATARFIATKLCRHYLGTAESHWVKRLAATFTATNGDVAAMLEPLLTSPDLTTAPPVMKRPLDFLVSALRAFATYTDCGKPLMAHLEEMGQPLNLWPMPDGYPDKTSAWTGSLLARWNFAVALLENQIGGTNVDLQRLSELSPCQLALGSSALEPALFKHARGSGEQAILALCSPEFQWR